MRRDLRMMGWAVVLLMSALMPVCAKAGTPDVGFTHEYTFATMSDGVKIALAVGYPQGFDATDTKHKWPVIFSIYGYAGATRPVNPSAYANRAVTVNASVRGTGASGGAFNPWTPRSRQDGYEVIEDWIVKQPWSDGKVGIIGHSWPGWMGFLVASTNPPSLKAVFVSGLIDDCYRGISYPGGVPNCGFPYDWLNNSYHPDGPFGSDAAAREARQLDDAAYRQILSSRPPRDLAQDALWLGMQERFDSPQWQHVSLGAQAPNIRAPIHIAQTYQDEQTGPSGWRLWKLIPESVPKRLVLSNGNHGVMPAYSKEMTDWFQHWILGEGDGKVADPAQRVCCYFETCWDKDPKKPILNPPLLAADFPLPDTKWTPYYLRAGNALSEAPPEGNEPPDSYRVGHHESRAKAAWVRYALEFKEPAAICGPMTLTLWAQLTTLDTDFFALLCDEDPHGKLYGLQRGLLRASHRQVDETRSEYVNSGGRRLLIRPYHPHTSAEPVTPHQPCQYQIEIPLVGHVFRPGHKLVLILSRVPGDDPIGVTKSGDASYRYDSHPPPGTVTLLHDAEHPSSLLLPVLPKLPPISANPPRPETWAGIQAVR